jgi:isopenicillin N synthase-like dioxygenase
MATITQTVQDTPPRALPKYQQAAESSHDLEWADLVTLDLSQFDNPGGKPQLANQLRDAVHNVGFFYVRTCRKSRSDPLLTVCVCAGGKITNFGLNQDEVDRQFAIGKELFALSEDEKLKHRARLEEGHYSGYRPKGTIELFPGLRDNVEMYNVFKHLPELERSHPDIVHEHRPEIERFQRHIAEDIIQKLLVLISIVLELPEDHLSNGHRYNDLSDCHLRYMIYRARTPEENAKYQNIYSRGHTDFGSLTLLFRQPVAALQVLMPDGSWKWVKPHPGSITVNVRRRTQIPYTYPTICVELTPCFSRSRTCSSSGRMAISSHQSTACTLRPKTKHIWTVWDYYTSFGKSWF